MRPIFSASVAEITSPDKSSSIALFLPVFLIDSAVDLSECQLYFWTDDHHGILNPRLFQGHVDGTSVGFWYNREGHESQVEEYLIPAIEDEFSLLSSKPFSFKFSKFPSVASNSFILQNLTLSRLSR